MACVQFKISSWLKRKIKAKTCESQDYVYLNWEFQRYNLIESEEKETNQKLEAKLEPKLMKISTVSKFENIHSWLQSQDAYLDNPSFKKSDCACCESEDIHYACVDVTQNSMFNSSRFNSEASLTSSELEDSFSEESYYSLQLRDQSRVLFSST